MQRRTLRALTGGEESRVLQGYFTTEQKSLGQGVYNNDTTMRIGGMDFYPEGQSVGWGLLVGKTETDLEYEDYGFTGEVESDVFGGYVVLSDDGKNWVLSIGGGLADMEVESIHANNERLEYDGEYGYVYGQGMLNIRTGLGMLSSSVSMAYSKVSQDSFTVVDKDLGGIRVSGRDGSFVSGEIGLRLWDRFTMRVSDWFPYVGVGYGYTSELGTRDIDLGFEESLSLEGVRIVGEGLSGSRWSFVLGLEGQVSDYWGIVVDYKGEFDGSTSQTHQFTGRLQLRF